MVFVFDLDDTLSETDSFSRQWIARFFSENGLPFRKVCDVARYSDGYFDWSHEEALAWYKKHGDEMMEEFPVKTGAREVLKLLHEKGHKIVISTARSKDWHVDPENVTLRWLEKNGLPYDEVYIGRDDKEKICEMTHADVFVDDDIEILERVTKYFERTGGRSFLPTTNFNRNMQLPEGAVRIERIFDILKNIQI